MNLSHNISGIGQRRPVEKQHLDTGYKPWMPDFTVLDPMRVGS